MVRHLYLMLYATYVWGVNETELSPRMVHVWRMYVFKCQIEETVNKVKSGCV